MHSATTVYMGSHGSNVMEAYSIAADPAVFKAGVVGHLKSDGTVSLTASEGSKIGVSLGRSLSDTSHVTFAVRGLKIPVLLTNGLTPVIGAQVEISATTGLAVASGDAVNALYRSAVLTAYDEDGVVIADGAALIDFPGGL